MSLLHINTRNNLLKIRSYDTHGIIDGLVSYSRILHSLQILLTDGFVSIYWSFQRISNFLRISLRILSLLGWCYTFNSFPL